MFATLVAASLYFTAATGGAHDGGTVFAANGRQITPVYDFCAKPNCVDGAKPVSVTSMPDGSLMGTTAEGGGDVEGYPAAGVVFRLEYRRDHWVETNECGICLYWRDCGHYGTARGQVDQIGPRTIEIETETVHRRRALYTFEALPNHKCNISKVRVWR